MYQYRKATPADLESIWDRSIADHRGDPQWITWKEEYIRYNRYGMGATFVVVYNGNPVGEGTLLFSSECGAIRGRTQRADGRHIANINALRIQKKHEGKGHISALVRMMEAYANELGYTCLTIGVETGEKRNRSIYRHWGYCELVETEPEGTGASLVLYYAKNLPGKTEG